MREVARPERDSDMRRSAPSVTEEHEIAQPEWRVESQLRAVRELFCGIARESDALFGENLLREARTIETERRSAAPEIRCSQESLNSARQCARMNAHSGDARREFDPGTLDPATTAVRQLDAPMTSSRAQRDHSTIPAEGRHQRAAAGFRVDLNERNHDTRVRAATPRSRLGLGARHDAPSAHPANVAVREVHDLPPASVAGSLSPANDLTQQQLAPELAAMVGPAPQIERGDGDNTEWPAGFAHSSDGLTST